MNKSKCTMILLLGVALTGTTAVTVHAQEGPPPGAWEPGPPPNNWSEAAHRGFHEGVEAARHDMEAGRPPDPDRHDSFRHPHDVPRDQRDDYRMGFRRGYRMVYEHHGHDRH